MMHSINDANDDDDEDDDDAAAVSCILKQSKAKHCLCATATKCGFLRVAAVAEAGLGPYGP